MSVHRRSMFQEAGALVMQWFKDNEARATEILGGMNLYPILSAVRQLPGGSDLLSFECRGAQEMLLYASLIPYAREAHRVKIVVPDASYTREVALGVGSYEHGPVYKMKLITHTCSSWDKPVPYVVVCTDAVSASISSEVYIVQSDAPAECVPSTDFSVVIYYDCQSRESMERERRANKSCCFVSMFMKKYNVY